MTTETKTHWRKQAALDEAERWRELNEGWAKGLPAELPGVTVKGNVPVVRLSQAQNGHEGAGLTWWRTDSKGGSDNCQGLTPWVGDWPTLPAGVQPALESCDLEAAEKRRAWNAQLPQLVRGPKGELPTWHPSHEKEPALSHTQLACRKGWAEGERRATLERVWGLPTVNLKPAAQKLPRRVAEGLANPVRLNDVTWVLGENRHNRVVRHCKRSHKKGSALDRLDAQQLTATGKHWWGGALQNETWGNRRTLSWSETDQEVVAAAEQGYDWADRLARAELVEWVTNRLTAKQLNALLAEDLSSPATRKAKERAKAKLQELPSHLRLRR